ncbi:putative di- and tripeptidase [Podosphaera aphanis]|nr:putative di- and tripeptidase [Podosphaera aphanis]
MALIAPGSNLNSFQHEQAGSLPWPPIKNPERIVKTSDANASQGVTSDEAYHKDEEDTFEDNSQPFNEIPELVHHLHSNSLILALAIGEEHLYAGTEDGNILVWSLMSFQLVQQVEAHTRSILCLFLSEDGSRLFSSAGDAIVNAWCSTSLKQIHHIYSTYDVGDVFSVVYSDQFETVYLGAQNTSIQWCCLKESDSRPPPNPLNHPDRRNHRFFDSVAHGGTLTPRSPSTRSMVHEGKLLEMDKSHMVQYAHFGYVYCMLMARGVSPMVDPKLDVLISGGGDGTIKLWKLSHDQNQGIQEIACLGEDDAVSVLSLAVDGSFLYSGKLEGVIELWNLDTKQKVHVIKAHSGDVSTLQIGWGFLFSAGSTGFAEKFTTIPYKNMHGSLLSNYKYHCTSHWKAHEGRVMASTITDLNGQQLYVTGASDNTISIWNIPQKTPTIEKKLETISENQLVKSLQEFVSYKTVSSRPEYAEDCRRGATFLYKLFNKHGAQTEMLNFDSQRNPVVCARFKGNPSTSANRKKILFYGHYDVVPADDKQKKWIINPFDMKGINGYLYGRGVSDNKGPIMAALYSVIDLIHEKELESDIVFLIEGEEECGSRGFKETIRKHKALIGQIDFIILANSYWIEDDVPCLTYGLRGVLHATVTVENKFRDVHSGVDGSFMMNEPLFDLTAILAKLKGPHNRIMIPGFYQDVLPLTPAEEVRYDDIVETLIRRNQALGPAGILKASLMARWREPNLTIHRYKVSGPDGSVVSSRASAAISFRLVPNQEVEDVVKSLSSFLSDAFAELDTRNYLSIAIDNHADAWLGDPDNTIFQTLEAAVIDVWGPIGESTSESKLRQEASPSTRRMGSGTKEASNVSTNPVNHVDEISTIALLSDIPQADVSLAKTILDYTNGNERKGRKPLYIREGGSIPSIRFLEKEFNAPAANLPCGQASDSAHLDNERLRISNLYNSRKIFKQVFRELPRK